MKETKKLNKKVILGVVALIAVVAVLAVVYFAFGAKPVAGAKGITIEVVDNEQRTTSYKLQTDAEFLRQAMNEVDGLTFSGAESEYGLMLDTVNGVTADYSVDGAYWSVMVNEEYGNYGIDTQPIEDGGKYQLVYCVD